MYTLLSPDDIINCKQGTTLVPMLINENTIRGHVIKTMELSDKDHSAADIIVWMLEEMPHL